MVKRKECKDVTILRKEIELAKKQKKFYKQLENLTTTYSDIYYGKFEDSEGYKSITFYRINHGKYECELIQTFDIDDLEELGLKFKEEKKRWYQIW